MRVIVVEPQKTIECGICASNNDWIRRINVEGITGLYCIKCDTLTVFEPLPSKLVYKAFKKETEIIRNTVIVQ